LLLFKSIPKHLMLMNPEQIDIRNKQKDSWNTFSPGWEKWDDLTMDFLKTQGDEIIEALELKPQDNVIDIAAGTGEPGLTMASIVHKGNVTGVDLSEKMLLIAEQKASDMGISNYSTSAADVCDLPYEDSTFDALSCRLGFMFFPDMQLAASEMCRVLKPGGRIATTVWGSPENNIWVTAIMGAIKRNIELPDPPAGAPGMFRCAQPGLVGSLFTGQGLKVDIDKVITGSMNCRSSDEYWNFMNDVAAPIVAAFKDADDETKSRIKREVYELLDQKIPGEEKNIPFEARLITAEKVA